MRCLARDTYGLFDIEINICKQVSSSKTAILYDSFNGCFHCIFYVFLVIQIEMHDSSIWVKSVEKVWRGEQIFQNGNTPKTLNKGTGNVIQSSMMLHSDLKKSFCSCTKNHCNLPKGMVCIVKNFHTL